MKKSHALSIVWRMVQFPLLLVGALMSTMVVEAHFKLMPTFVSSKNRDFWDDVMAFRIRAEGAKSLDQLYADYGPYLVHDYVIERSLEPGLIPSDDSTRTLWVGGSIRHDGGKTQKVPAFGPGSSGNWLFLAIGWFPVFLLPVSMFLGSLTRNVAWAFARSRRSQEIFAEYYDTPFYQRAVGWLVSLPMVVALAALSAHFELTPDLRRVGFTLADLTFIAVLQSYMSGIMLRFVRGLIDAVFIALRINPDRSIIDDLISVILFAPVLLLLYRNAPLSILADLVAGLGPMLIVKLIRGVQTRLMRGPIEVERAADGSDAVSRNFWLALSATFIGLMLTCGGCLTTAVAGLSPNVTSTPKKMTVAEAEASGLPGAALVELTDGYLFWPLRESSDTKTGFSAIGEFDESFVGHYYVPLVSKPVLDEWVAEYKRGGDPKYSLKKCRVFVSFRPAEVKHRYDVDFIGVFGDEPYSAAGTIRGSSTSIPKAIRQKLQPLSRDANFETISVVRNDSRPPGMGIWVGLLVLGLIAIAPLGIRFIYVGRRPVEEAIPVAVAPDSIPTLEAVDEPKRRHKR